MADSVEVLAGFSRRDSDPPRADEVFVPGYLDNPVITESSVMHDARGVDVSLEGEGFELIHHETAYADVRDRSILVDGYMDEVAAVLKEHFGAKLVVPNRGALLVRYGKKLVSRTEPEGDKTIIDDKIPATFMHLDYLSEYCIDQAASNAKREGYDHIDYKRMMVVQTWRAVSAPPQDSPLAICDTRTLGDNDFSRRRGTLAPKNAKHAANPTFEIDCVHYNPNQKWYYYPSMTADELLIMTGFDTAREDGGRVAHGAFDNRANDPGANERESIEARFYVYFD